MIRPAERADAVRNRTRLLAAAREVFAERGVGADIREICERSGLGVATLYRNFATKDDLIEAIRSEMMADVEALIAEASTDPDPAAAISRVIEGALDTVQNSHQLARALELLPGEHHHKDPSEPLFEQVAAMLRRGQEHDVVRGDIAAELLIDVLGSVFLLYLELLDRWPQSVARDTVTRMVWAALSPQADGPPGPASETRE